MGSSFLTDITTARSFLLGFSSKLGGKGTVKMSKTKHSYYSVTWLMSTHLILPLWHLNFQVLSPQHQVNAGLQQTPDVSGSIAESIKIHNHSLSEYQILKPHFYRMGNVFSKHCSMIPNEMYNMCKATVLI